MQVRHLYHHQPTTFFPHGSRFASSAGQVINGPANDPL